jgi:hypothetical protein
MENVSIFYEHLVYFMAIGNILWPFGIFCGHLVYFAPFWYFEPRKIWHPWRILVLGLHGLVYSFSPPFVFAGFCRRK